MVHQPGQTSDSGDVWPLNHKSCGVVGAMRFHAQLQGVGKGSISPADARAFERDLGALSFLLVVFQDVLVSNFKWIVVSNFKLCAISCIGEHDETFDRNNTIVLVLRLGARFRPGGFVQLHQARRAVPPFLNRALTPRVWVRRIHCINVGG